MMDRSLPMLLIGLVFGGGVGFVVAAGNGVTLDGHDHASHDHGSTVARPVHGDASGVGVIFATGDICAPQGDRAAHRHDQIEEVGDAAARPSLSAEIAADPAAGWTLRLTTQNFDFAPEHAGCAHEPGEGHAHIYVNGEKIARLYGPWFHLASLPKGDVTVEVGLYTNDHRAIAVNGVPVSASVAVSVP